MCLNARLISYGLNGIKRPPMGVWRIAKSILREREKASDPIDMNKKGMTTKVGCGDKSSINAAIIT